MTGFSRLWVAGGAVVIVLAWWVRSSSPPPSHAETAPSSSSFVLPRAPEPLPRFEPLMAPQAGPAAGNVTGGGTAPADLPARFRRDALMKALAASFAELRMQGEVTRVDCSEYPCIAFGRAHGGRLMPGAFKTLKALHAYEHDLPHATIFDVDGPDHAVALAYTWNKTGDDDLDAAFDDDLEKRIELRVSRGMDFDGDDGDGRNDGDGDDEARP